VLPPIPLDWHVHLVHQRHEQVGHRRLSEYVEMPPPLSRPAPPPITRSGRLSPECVVLCENARAIQDRHVSSREPSPSGVALSFARYCENSWT